MEAGSGAAGSGRDRRRGRGGLDQGESEEGSKETLAQNVRLEQEGTAGPEVAQGDTALAGSQRENTPGDLGGEAPREGPRSPVGELVEDRAYPRSYVSDRLALKGSGTDVARHGSSSANGGRRTPPNAPALGVYKSTDHGKQFRLLMDLQRQTPANPRDPASGVDWFQGGVNKLELDPWNPRTIYAAVFGYGVWRSVNGGKTWKRVFRTIYPNDTFGDRTEFDLVRKGGHTRAYVGDSSDDLFVAQVWRANKVDTKSAGELVNNLNVGWTKLSSTQNGTNGFLAYYYCQNGQCGYDDFVVSPPGHPNQLWLGGSMNYDELPLYGGQPPRSNGRAVIRSTNAGDPASQVTWQDMTQDAQPPGSTEGMHPDQHAIVFDPKNPGTAWVGSDGGVIRVNVKNPVDKSGQCSQRRYDYGSGEQPLEPADLKDCQRLLSAIRGISTRR